MNTPFTVFDTVTGQVLKTGSTSLQDFELQAQAGESILPITVDFYTHYVDVASGKPTEIPIKSLPCCLFDWITKEWYDPRTLQDIRDAATNHINNSWDEATINGFEYSGKYFSTTSSSRSDIDGINGYVALCNAFPEGWVGAWKAKDSTYLPITSTEEWKAFYTAMVVAGLSNFSKAQQLKAQLAAATTPEEVEAVVW
jgi:hypothetical protein